MSGSDVNGISGLFPLRVPGAAADRSAPGNDAPARGKALPVAVRQELEIAAASLLSASRTIGRAIRFRVDLVSGQEVIHVLDRDTGEVIRRIRMEKLSKHIASFGREARRLRRPPARRHRLSDPLRRPEGELARKL